jgi:hypothetical protein
LDVIEAELLPSRSEGGARLVVFVALPQARDCLLKPDHGGQPSLVLFDDRFDSRRTSIELA